MSESPSPCLHVERGGERGPSVVMPTVVRPWFLPLPRPAAMLDVPLSTVVERGDRAAPQGEESRFTDEAAPQIGDENEASAPSKAHPLYPPVPAFTCEWTPSRHRPSPRLRRGVSGEDPHRP